MANHLHIVLIVDNPDDVSNFMCRLKTEISNRINRLLGRRNRSIWSKSFHGPTILTPENVIDKIAYLYANPSKADLEDSIEKYPGVSSWALFTQNKKGFATKLVKRTAISKLKRTKLSAKEQANVFNDLKKKSKKRQVFRFHPNAWFESFDITDPVEQNLANQRIIERVRALEDEYRTKRAKEKKKVLGAAATISQPLDFSYYPSTYGKKMTCIGNDIRQRVNFNRFLSDLRRQGRSVSALWKQGDYSVPYPLGLFPPGTPRVANFIPKEVSPYSFC